MTKPAALIHYENLLAGNQLVNRLQDLGYRVVLVTDLTSLVRRAEEERPMVFVASVGSAASPVGEAVRALRSNEATAHIPVLAFTKETDREIGETARRTGATLVADEAGILTQLPELLNQVLEVT